MRDDTLPNAPGPRREGRGGRLLALLFAALLGVTAFLGYNGDLARWSLRDDYLSYTLIAPPLPPLDTALVAGVVEPTLVNINSTVRPFGLGAAGSGIVLTAQGQVLTSHHVIKGAESVTVSDIGTGQTYPARVLGYDSGADIALLELSGADALPAARLGTSSILRLGDEVLAIGNAGGTGSPTAVGGEITGLDNSIVARNSSDLSRKQLRGMIEVAAAVAAGQSGGALVNRYGAVVGVVTAASGEVQKALGKGPNGYAVPIDTAMHIVEQIRSGTPTDTVHIGPTATLGVMTADSQRPAGARIEVTVQGMPAQAAGLLEGEVITAVDGRVIDGVQALKAVLNTRKPDEVVRLDLTEPGGTQRTVSVTLTVGPPN
ncbi:trypsin-like peptidase domain-containing protein [Nocardia sp. 2]|uniref:Trypsin-like peptidase domain-containing protein n=1 Tax=Nocardia acididurans TaxID=2802282 RepID=A0ABS1M559_9NOCA|nr:trypsin-like peptidase domain-containing protein [Nocardia acididurans]MBL1075772.1 trypsin-like peptidase domain-containing protein [Nocardia acididurans]